MSAVTDDDQISKHAPPIPSYLCEQMTVGRMIEALERLQFNKREEARLMIDPALIRATKAGRVD